MSEKLTLGVLDQAGEARTVANHSALLPQTLALSGHSLGLAICLRIDILSRNRCLKRRFRIRGTPGGGDVFVCRLLPDGKEVSSNLSTR